MKKISIIFLSRVSLIILGLLFCYNLSFSQVQIGTTTYTTLKSAFDAVNNGLHPGNITILITGNTTETMTAQLYIDAVTCPSITIRPSGGDRTISGNIDGNLIEIYSDNVTIDGSTTVGGTSRNLSITNTNSTVTYVPTSLVFVFGDNQKVKNCNIYNLATGTGMGIYVLATSNTLIENCWIYKTDRAIYAIGYNDGTYQYPVYNISIKKNKIGSSSSSEKIRWRGIMLGPAPAASSTGTWITNVDGFSIEDNEIFGLENSNYGSSLMGIGCLLGVVNGNISRNKIHDIKVNTVSAGAYGMYIGFNPNTATPTTSYANANITIDNNFIYDIYTATANNIGIVAGYLSNIKMYHNTIYLYGSSPGPATSACFWLNPAGSSFDIRNNIFKNTLAGNSGWYTNCIFANSYGTSSPFSQINYNDYICSSNGTNYIGTYYNNGTPVTCTDLSAWQTAISAEANGISIDPTFKSTTDLHIDGGTVTNTSFLAPNITDITKDIDNETRKTGSGNVTYMGADEVIPNITYTQDLTILPAPICEGTPFTLNVIANLTFGDGISRNVSLSYAWYKNNILISGVSTNTFSKNPSTSGDAGTYYVEASLLGTTIRSRNSVVDIHSLAQISRQPDQFYYTCEGFPFQTPPYVIVDGTVLGYQWQKENPNTKLFEDIPGQTTNTLNLPIDDAELLKGTYRVRITGGVCNQGPLYSNTATITVSVPLTEAKITWPEGFTPGNVCLGDRIELTAEGQGTVTGYQWQRVESDGKVVDIPLAENPTAQSKVFVIESAKLSDNATYQCKIFGSLNCNTPYLISNSCKIAVWNWFEITKQPESHYVCVGESVNMFITTEGTVYGYQWQKDGEDISSEKNPSAVTPLLMLSNLQFKDAGVYRCLLDIEDCRGKRTISTIEVLIYVHAPTKITRQPETQYPELGQTARFDFDAQVGGRPDEPTGNPTVQWYRGGIALVDNDRIAGSKSSILSIRNIDAGDYGDDYYVVINGYCGSDKSQNFGIKVPPGISIITAPTDQDVCLNSTARLEVQATITGGGTELRYQWFKNGVPLKNDNRINGVKSSVLTINNVVSGDEGDYEVQITVLPTMTTKIAGPAKLTVKFPPELKEVKPGVEIDIESGKELKIEVVVEGNNLQYQWFKDRVPLTGETNPTYEKAAADATDAGIYYCKVTNECGEITTPNIAVTVTMSNMFMGLENKELSEMLSLSNSPNPFLDKTIISFVLPYSAQVKLSITDIFGRELAIIKDEMMNSGLNEIEFKPETYNISSGTYFYTITLNGYKMSKSMTFIK